MMPSPRATPGPPPHPGLARRARECEAMIAHALRNGWSLPPGLAEDCRAAAARGETEPLLRCHAALSRLVAPARPGTLVLLDGLGRGAGWMRRLWPVPLVRRMAVAALAGAAVCILLALASVAAPGKGPGGVPQVLGTQVFRVGAAAVGASCAALAHARHSLRDRSWDGGHQTADHARWLLGVAAGVALGMTVPGQGAFRAGPLLHAFLPAAAGAFAAPWLGGLAGRVMGAAGGLVRPSRRPVTEASVSLARLRALRRAGPGPRDATPFAGRGHAT